MEIVIGLFIWTIAHMYFIKKIDEIELKEHPYETEYCRDVRVSDDRISDDVTLEMQRYRVNKKNSKF
jgi:hypothetical protein